MVVKSKIKFTPEVLSEAPRQSGAIPNDLGTYALYTVSKYCIETNTTSKEVRILDIETGRSKLFSDDEKVESPKWLINNFLIWKRRGDGGTSELWIGNAVSDEKNAYLAGKISANISGLNTAVLPKGNIALTFTAAVSEDGELLNVETIKKTNSSAREWETARVRYWAAYQKPYGSTLWYTTLEKKNPDNSKWTLGKSPVDALKGTVYLFPWTPSNFRETPYEISSSGILLSTIDDVNYSVADDYMNECLYIPLKTFTEDEPPPPIVLQPKGKRLRDAGTAAFAIDGKKAAILKADNVILAASASFKVYVFDTENPDLLYEVKILNDAEQDWDLPVRRVLFSETSEALYVIADYRGRALLYSVDLVAMKDGKGYEPAIAKTLTRTGVTMSVHLIKNQTSGNPARLFVNSNSFVDSCKYTIVYPSSGHDEIISSATKNGALFGISPTQISEFSFKGQGDYQVQSFIIRPSNFQADKKYPCLFSVHGGPTASWSDGWSSWWNAVLLAQQGYIVILPNITGSTGFGSDFTKAVFGDWGGRPYGDLENCFKYIENNLKYVDVDRVVAIGGSYGGYMMNWIAGKPLAKKFKTLVNHDGIFTLSGNLLACDVVSGLKTELGCNYWDDQKKWDDHDPSKFTANWTQPMLIIHSDEDYRCPMAGGLAPFNVCMLKGIEARLLNFPDETHAITRDANALFWLNTIIGWCNKYAGVEDGIKLQPPVSESHIRGRRKLAMRLAKRET